MHSMSCGVLFTGVYGGSVLDAKQDPWVKFLRNRVKLFVGKTRAKRLHPGIGEQAGVGPGRETAWSGVRATVYVTGSGIKVS